VRHLLARDSHASAGADPPQPPVQALQLAQIRQRAAAELGLKLRI
jgi:hypothetical protein